MTVLEAVVTLHRICNVRSCPVLSVHQPDRLWWLVHVADDYCCSVLQLSVDPSLDTSAVDCVDLFLDVGVGPLVRYTGYDDLLELDRLLFLFSGFHDSLLRCCPWPVSYTHLRAHETDSYLVCRLL